MAWRRCKICQGFYDDKAYYARKGLCFNCMSKLEEVYGKVHDYLKTHHELRTFNAEMIAREIKETPEDVENLFELGFLERDFQTYNGIKTERQELASKFKRELNVMSRQRRHITYGGIIYDR